MSKNYLKNYIVSNSDASIEEVLNDEDFLDELKQKDESMMN